LVFKLTQLTNDYWTTMYILYGLAFVSFLFSHLFFKLKKTNWGNIFITIALFLNPFGYDIVVYAITLLTKSYWLTMSIMYMLAFAFFGLFMYFYNINPLKAFKYHAVNTHRKLTKKK